MKTQPHYYVRHHPPGSETAIIETVSAPNSGAAFASVLKLYPGTRLLGAERTGTGVMGNFILRCDPPSTCSVDPSANGMANESYEQDLMPFFNDPEVRRKRKMFR
jgi:hypothetical protein